MKRVIIIGASSGMGMEVAKLFLDEGYRLGVAARREDRLQTLKQLAPDRVEVQAIDVTDDDATSRLRALIDRLGGMDLFFYASGIGKQNRTLTPDIELNTVNTNSMGFTRMIGEAYRYFAERGEGHIVAITSIAGTKGLGPAPSYSATKAFQNVYLQSLEQQANARKQKIARESRPSNRQRHPQPSPHQGHRLALCRVDCSVAPPPAPPVASPQTVTRVYFLLSLPIVP